MNRSTQILARLYALLLKFYPRAYQVEYSEELEAVFGLAAKEAAQGGRFSVMRMGLRELRDLPGAIILEHQRERRKRNMANKRGSRLTFEPGSWRETLVAVAPFLLLGTLSHALGLLPLNIPQWLGSTLFFGLLGFLLSLLVAGMVKGLPRWALPYLGVVLSPISVYGFHRLVSGLHPVLVSRSAPWFLRQTVYQGLLWIGLLAATLLIVLVAGILPPLRPFYRRIRGDWTLLSFALYGTLLFALILTFDDYPYDEPYIIAGTLILALGGWFYLRSPRPRQRALALFAGMTLAMAVAATGKAIIYSSSGWPYFSYMFTWQSEAMSTVIMWGWLVLMVFSPILLNLLPRQEPAVPTE